MLSIPFEVEKTVIIDRDSADVFEAISDFATWTTWSPWFCQEPTCPVTIEGTKGTEGHSQSWEGEIIGSGRIQIAKVLPNESLEYDLRFLKPWKSRSTTGFNINSIEEGTEVRWWMRGSLPIFAFFMKKMMLAMIESDYSRGLSMLKEYLETGKILSETTVRGLSNRRMRYYIGRRRSCSMAEVGQAMEEDFSELGRLLEGSDIPKTEEAFSIYHSYDLIKGQCEYTSGLLYDAPQEAPEGCVKGKLPAHRALRVDHRGPYRNLGNAWVTAMSHSRLLYKANKKLPMYEIYPNNPHEVEESEVRVEIYIPLRG